MKRKVESKFIRRKKYILGVLAAPRLRLTHPVNRRRQNSHDFLRGVGAVFLYDPIDRRQLEVVATSVAENFEGFLRGGELLVLELVMSEVKSPDIFGDAQDRRLRVVLEVEVPVVFRIATGVGAGVAERLTPAAGRERRRFGEGNCRAAKDEVAVLASEGEGILPLRFGVGGNLELELSETVSSAKVPVPLADVGVLRIAMSTGDSPAAAILGLKKREISLPPERKKRENEER